MLRLTILASARRFQNDFARAALYFIWRGSSRLRLGAVAVATSPPNPRARGDRNSRSPLFIFEDYEARQFILDARHRRASREIPQARARTRMGAFTFAAARYISFTLRYSRALFASCFAKYKRSINARERWSFAGCAINRGDVCTGEECFMRTSGRSGV